MLIGFGWDGYNSKSNPVSALATGRNILEHLVPPGQLTHIPVVGSEVIHVAAVLILSSHVGAQAYELFAHIQVASARGAEEGSLLTCALR
jgi:hypothetical protein